MTNNHSHIRGNRLRAMAAAVFGLCVIASGMWRFFSAEGGHAGLWFGVVMGALALTSAMLFWKQQGLAANPLLLISLAFVGGWFCYESLIKKGLANAELRQLIIIGLTLATALFWIWTLVAYKEAGSPQEQEAA